MRSFFSLSVSVVRCSTCARNSVFTASSSPTRLNSVAFLVLRLAREDCEAMLFFCLLTKYLWSFTMGFVFFTLLAVLCEFCLWEDVYSGSDSVGIDAYEWSWLTTTSCWDSIGESCSSSGLLKPRASSEKSKVTSLSVEQEKGDTRSDKSKKGSTLPIGEWGTLKSGEVGKGLRTFVSCRSPSRSVNSIRNGSSKPLGSIHSKEVDWLEGGLLWQGEGEGITPSSPAPESSSDMNISSRRWQPLGSRMSVGGEESTSGGLKSPGVENRGTFHTIDNHSSGLLVFTVILEATAINTWVDLLLCVNQSYHPDFMFVVYLHVCVCIRMWVYMQCWRHTRK